MSGAQRIILGVGASIAAFKVVELLRLLTKAGYEVQVAPTPQSLNFVGPTTWEALSGRPALTDVFDTPDPLEHISLADRADLLVVMPATADLLARLRHGLGDSMLSVLALAVACPVVVVPAMHPTMWEHPATQENVTQLAAWGWQMVGPYEGELADGQVGRGRMAEAPEVFEVIQQALSAPSSHTSAASAGPGTPGGISARPAPTPVTSVNPVTNGPLTGKRVLISAGGTQEPWDQVRYLGNRSSGRQGCALAEAALAAGAEVELVLANVDKSLIPPAAQVIQAPTAGELAVAMRQRAQAADLIFQCAAVADFRPRQIETGKLSRHSEQVPHLELERTEDVLQSLLEDRQLRRQAGAQIPQLIIGFAAQTGTLEEVLASGRAKAQRKGCDLLVVNPVGQGRGFGNVNNEVYVLDAQGMQVGSFSGSKAQVAAYLLDLAGQYFL